MKHKNQLIYPKIRVHSLLILDGSIGIILDHRIRGVFAPEMLLLFAETRFHLTFQIATCTFFILGSFLTMFFQLPNL